MVPKSRLAKLSLTVHPRPINGYTVQYQVPMPNLENELLKLEGSFIYANLDLLHGYWQLLLAMVSQECQNFGTPDGIFSPTRVMHGIINAVTHLRTTIKSELDENLYEQLLVWLDDLLMYSNSIPQHLNGLRRLLAFFQRLNLKQHPKKCML